MTECWIQNFDPTAAFNCMNSLSWASRLVSFHDIQSTNIKTTIFSGANPHARRMWVSYIKYYEYF